jgi:hypothetical protein
MLILGFGSLDLHPTLNFEQLYNPRSPVGRKSGLRMKSPPLKTELARSLDSGPYQTALSVVLCAYGCGLHDRGFR